MQPDVVVIGSINHDLTVVTSRFPAPGETVLGSDHYSGGGGKGANQAVAAARLGARVALVGRVGDDEHGDALRTALVDYGVEVSAVSIDREAPTGLAVITVDDTADNMIVVSPGANARLTPGDLDGDLIGSAAVVLTQLEIPLETVIAAAELATGTFILNPAPARHLPRDLLERVDVLVPNRSELAIISRAEEPATIEEAIRAVRRLERNALTVVTLGSTGAVIVDGETERHVPAPDVVPIDPTGAGDAFCGALAHALAGGSEPTEAVTRAVVAGALATTRRGAQPAMPTAAEIEEMLGS
ncbi:MAG TPA: ribokinase [Acidimicrobiia bacterium]|nr:ribokinase [Acidimicrobiia bacterium]